MKRLENGGYVPVVTAFAKQDSNVGYLEKVGEEMDGRDGKRWEVYP